MCRGDLLGALEGSDGHLEEHFTSKDRVPMGPSVDESAVAHRVTVNEQVLLVPTAPA